MSSSTDKVIHVLVSGFTSNYGGVETFLFQQFKHMDHNKIHIDFLTHVKNPAFQSEIESMGGKFFYIPVRNRYPLKYRKELHRFFRNHAKEYDVFWCNKCMLNNIDFLKYAAKYHIPVRILHSHNSSNMDTGIKGWLMELMHKRNRKKVLSYATNYWACSDLAAKWNFPLQIYKDKRYTFIPNAVDAAKFQLDEKTRNEMRKKLGLAGHYVIGHIGRFNYQKNHEFLIRMFRKLHNQDADARLLLIGTGELEEQVKRQVHELKLDSVVMFLGVRHDIPQLMQAMDCFVLPSRFEGFPVVAVEAQAAGLPCVLAKDGITEQVKITDNVRFMKLNDSEEKWVKAILNEANKRKDTYQTLKDKGFNIKEAAEKISNIINSYVE